MRLCREDLLDLSLARLRPLTLNPIRISDPAGIVEKVPKMSGLDLFPISVLGSIVSATHADSHQYPKLPPGANPIAQEPHNHKVHLKKLPPENKTGASSTGVSRWCDTSSTPKALQNDKGLVMLAP